MSKGKRKRIDVLMCAAIPRRAGGMYNNMYYTAKALERRGFHCELMLNSPLEDSVPVRLLKYLAPYTIAAKVLLKLFVGNRIRIVEIHEPSAYFYCILKKLLPFLPKCFVRSHGVEELVFETESKHYAFPLSTRLLQRLRNRLNRIGFALSDLIIVNNRTDKAFLEKKYRVKTIVSSISVPGRVSAAKATAKQKVVFMGQWTKKKGSHFIERIVPRVLEKAPGLKCYLLGVGREKCDEVKQIFKEFKGKVFVVPEYSREELAKYLNEYDVLVCPSVYESGPFTVLEAMACKLAVVCSENCFLIRDLASKGEVVFVESGNTVGFVEAILELVENNEKRMAIAIAGFNLIKNHTWDKAVESYAKHLRLMAQKE